jgi:hypothetical protein
VNLEAPARDSLDEGVMLPYRQVGARIAAAAAGTCPRAANRAKSRAWTAASVEDQPGSGERSCQLLDPFEQLRSVSGLILVSMLRVGGDRHDHMVRWSPGE